MCGEMPLPIFTQTAVDYAKRIEEGITMRCASLGLIAVFSSAGCSQGPVASPPAPGVPLSNVLNEIKQELAEYNREAAAEPIQLKCNGRQPVSMSLTSVRAEVQSTLVDQVGRDVGAQIPLDAIPVLINLTRGASRSITNRQTTVLNFDVPPARQGAALAANATMPEDMNLLKALMTFRDQLGHVPPDGQCLKFANKDPASIAVDFTADEQEKGGIKMTILTLNAVGTAARDHNTITVTLDMKGAIKKAASAPAPPIMPYFKESQHDHRHARHERRHERSAAHMRSSQHATGAIR
jgi:hypothetical protein